MRGKGGQEGEGNTALGVVPSLFLYPPPFSVTNRFVGLKRVKRRREEIAQQLFIRPLSLG